jgi:hypothetical protein
MTPSAARIESLLLVAAVAPTWPVPEDQRVVVPGPWS